MPGIVPEGVGKAPADVPVGHDGLGHRPPPLLPLRRLQIPGRGLRLP